MTYLLSQIELNTSISFIIFLLVLRGIAIGLIIQNSQLAALMDVPLPRLNRATPLVQATRQTMQSIGVAVLATILSSAVMLTIPAIIPSASSLAKLSPTAQATILQRLYQFQAQYITGLEHAYLATFAIAIAATLISLFLPGWPGKYLPASQRGAAPVPEPETSEVG